MSHESQMYIKAQPYFVTAVVAVSSEKILGTPAHKGNAHAHKLHSCPLHGCSFSQ